MHQRKKSIITKTEEAKMDGREVTTLGELIEENKERRAKKCKEKMATDVSSLDQYTHLFLFLSFWFH